MKRIFILLATIMPLTFSASALADMIDVSYDITSYRGGGYSASWLHEATNCSGSSGANSGQTLYMCDDNHGDNNAITGTIFGTYDTDTGILTILDGVLNIDGMGLSDIIGGSLGGAFGDGTSGLGGLNWFLDVDGLDRFFFEDIGMDPNGPTYYGYDRLVLWGQNDPAYRCRPSQCGNRWGVDLYGRRVAVTEPGTLALIGIGLLAIAATRRRRKVVANPNS